MAKLQLDDKKGEDKMTNTNDKEYEDGNVQYIDNQTDYIKMFHIKENDMDTAFLDKDDSVTILSHHYVEHFSQELQ